MSQQNINKNKRKHKISLARDSKQSGYESCQRRI